MYQFWVNIILLFYVFQNSKCQILEPKTDIFNLEGQNAVSSESINEYLANDQKNSKSEGAEGNDYRIELFPADPSLRGQRRQPRTIFPKLHSAASFLAGLKLGKILSKKGFELGHGKIASSHTFQLFGKTVNSATSLAYGDNIPFLPALDDTSESGNLKSGLVNKDVYHVTVVENPSNKTIQKLDNILFDEIDDNDTNNEVDSAEKLKIKKHVVRLYQEGDAEDNTFLQEHNNLVKQINQNIKRRNNSKF